MLNFCKRKYPHHIYLCDKFEPVPKAPAAKPGSGAGKSKWSKCKYCAYYRFWSQGHKENSCVD